MPAAQASAAGGTITLTETSYYPASAGPIYTYLNTVFNNFEKTHPGIIVKREDIPNSPRVPDDDRGRGLSWVSPRRPYARQPDGPHHRLVQRAHSAELARQDRHPERSAAAQQAEAKFNGTIYGYPLYTNTIALFYNKAMLSAANIRPRPPGHSSSQIPRR